MGLIKNLRKKYWSSVILNGGENLATACDLKLQVPAKVYALFSKEELKTLYEKIIKDKEEAQKLIAELD